MRLISALHRAMALLIRLAAALQLGKLLVLALELSSQLIITRQTPVGKHRAGAGLIQQVDGLSEVTVNDVALREHHVLLTMASSTVTR
jgi:hypothetical protein